MPGIEVFGGISLDLTVGGVNPAAVEWMTKVKGGYGRVVWLPTFDSEAQVKLSGQQRPFAPVVRDGKVVPEVAQVIAIAARNNLVFETGHSSGSEDLVIIEEARRQGVQNVMVTHALTNPGGPLTLSEIQQAAKMGAYIELVYGERFASARSTWCGSAWTSGGSSSGSVTSTRFAASIPSSACRTRSSIAQSPASGQRHRPGGATDRGGC